MTLFCQMGNGASSNLYLTPKVSDRLNDNNANNLKTNGKSVNLIFWNVFVDFF